ncbi:hydroxyacid dehydrogenase [Planctomonas psychrotolerans]|uniref:hydroxyacid dehydrogenase n=1 Tax=Planctomonas psychrotolerans TaxID=2528712 RepID=UPI001D0D7C03|nr:hydroxyacid dehydrogenase [Planctomonas psychrotolerans]
MAEPGDTTTVEPSGRPAVLFAMRSDELREQLFPAPQRAALSRVADVLSDTVLTEFDSPDARALLGRADVLITGWGCPRIDAEVLDAAPSLRLVAHAAGTVKGHIDREVWHRGVAVTTAAEANARPVAEYTLAAILLAGKQAFARSRELAAGQGEYARPPLPLDAGNFGATVGIIGASRVGRIVLDLLRPFSFELLLATPDLSPAEAEALGARLVPLGQLMAESAVVSLHAPLLPSTVGMIGRAELAAMRDGAAFVNTARGAIVDTDALRDETRSGRISAVLDVTDPEPLSTGDELYTFPNVFLTPHIAGAMGNELSMMGDAAVTEVARLAAGRPLRYPVSLLELDTMA